MPNRYYNADLKSEAVFNFKKALIIKGYPPSPQRGEGGKELIIKAFLSSLPLGSDLERHPFSILSMLLTDKSPVF